jgi:hypothetical protein
MEVSKSRKGALESLLGPRIWARLGPPERLVLKLLTVLTPLSIVALVAFMALVPFASFVRTRLVILAVFGLAGLDVALGIGLLLLMTVRAMTEVFRR